MLARSSDLQDQVQPSRGFHRWLRRPFAPVRSPFQPWLSPEPHPPPARHARPGTAPSPHPVLQKHPLRGSVSRADSGPTRPRLLLRSPQIRLPFSFSLFAYLYASLKLFELGTLHNRYRQPPLEYNGDSPRTLR